MLTRRHLLTALAAGGILFAVGPDARAQSESQATNFVMALGNELVSVIDGPGSYEEKKERLRPTIERAVDVDGIAEFVLGPFRRGATRQQLAEFTAVFHDVLMNSIFSKLGQFQGVTFRPTNTVPRGRDMLVGTLIKRPNEQANNVQWVVTNVRGQPKIDDVIAEGTSLRLTQRSDYTSYMQRNGRSVEALIEALKRQASRQG